MKVLKDLSEIKKRLKNPVITIGNFDGVHLGHQRLIKLLVNRAREIKGKSVIMTFHPHTRKLLNHKPPLLINTEEQKIQLLAAIGPDYLYISEFNQSVATMEAEDFVKEVLIDKIGMKIIYFSTSFAFGHNRKGNIILLNKLSERYKFELIEVQPIKMNNSMINSSIIRELIANGNIEKAGHFLGRDHFIDGIVVPGNQRGRTLQYPTANIKTENELLPKHGVYISQLKLGDQIIEGITNIGVRPTFQESERSIETYLFDFDKKIYGDKVRLFFLKKVRDERKFKDKKQLSKQIEKDIEKARRYFIQN